ncbi:MAG: N-6 DNA methylase [Clostridia bacterium]|nr:N-6 DNA methylase [Clostridia bacterium]
MSTNIQAKANLIWEVATKLVGVYKPHEYGKVILPMTVLKRFDDILKPTKQAVLDKYEEVKNFEVKDAFLTEASGYCFYNTSKYDFEKLLSDPDNIESNFKNYLNGFSDNVIDILSNFKFNNEVKTMVDNRLLYVVIEEFNSKKAYMGLDEVKTEDMGYIFEELVRKFSESYDEEAGAHFTARDIIYLMTDLLVAEEQDILINDNKVKTIYDMAMGTSQMLACMTDRLKQLNKNVKVDCYGQELNPETYAIAKADMLIKGGDADNFKQGDTLDDDQFKGYTFDYIISNPPFGIDWKKQKKVIEDEVSKGVHGRFPVGTPKISDSQMLFTLNGIAKLKDEGKMAIIQNGSPLFSGAAGSGESEIRRYIIENDWLEAIIQLPTDLFYNTGISTYIWLINKGKEGTIREGKVQLIDASNCYINRRKNIGNKRKDLDEESRKLILQAYSDFMNKEYSDEDKMVESKVFDNSDFGYNRITIETPEIDENQEFIKDKKGNIKADSNKRDYENVPLKEDVEEYFKREVLPYNENAWVDKKKTQIGYEIPFTRYFYKYVEPESSDDILARIRKNESDIINSLKKLFEEDE